MESWIQQAGGTLEVKLASDLAEACTNVMLVSLSACRSKEGSPGRKQSWVGRGWHRGRGTDRQERQEEEQETQDRTQRGSDRERCFVLSFCSVTFQCCDAMPIGGQVPRARFALFHSQNRREGDGASGTQGRGGGGGWLL